VTDIVGLLQPGGTSA